VMVTELPRSGWVVQAQQGVTIALDTELTAELEAEGVARDLVRVIQQARREAGLEISDRVAVLVAAPGEVAAAVEPHRPFVMSETLATGLDFARAIDAGFAGTVGNGTEIAVQVTRA